MTTTRSPHRILTALACTLLAGLACAAPVAAPPPAWELPANFVRPEDRNAAIRYWQALGMLNSATNDQVRSMLVRDPADPAAQSSWFDESTDEGKASAEHAFYIANRLVAATNSSYCNFEIDYEEGVGALLPHLGRMRSGAYLLRLCARESATRDQPEQAAEYLAALIRMSHHAAQDPILICSLVGVAMTNMALDETERLLAADSLTSSARDIIADALRDLPASDPMNVRGSIEGERAIFLGWVAHIADDPARLHDLIDIAGSPDDMHAQSFAKLIEQGPDAVRASVQRAQHAYDMVLQAWDEPDASTRLDGIADLTRKGAFGVSATLFMPSFTRARSTDQAFRERLDRVQRMLEE